MSSQQDQQVTIRILPDGVPWQAIFDRLDGRVLWLHLPPRTPADFHPGTLVEVSTAGTLYLGVIRGGDQESTAIDVEHALDRETLATIQQVWHGPENR